MSEAIERSMDASGASAETRLAPTSTIRFTSAEQCPPQAWAHQGQNVPLRTGAP
jgi:hypothetical protein